MSRFKTDLSFVAELEQKLARVRALITAMSEMKGIIEPADEQAETLGELLRLALDVLPGSWDTYEALQGFASSVHQEVEAQMRQARALDPAVLTSLINTLAAPLVGVETVRSAGMQLARYADEDEAWRPALDIWQRGIAAKGWTLSWREEQTGSKYLELENRMFVRRNRHDHEQAET